MNWKLLNVIFHVIGIYAFEVETETLIVLIGITVINV